MFNNAATRYQFADLTVPSPWAPVGSELGPRRQTLTRCRFETPGPATRRCFSGRWRTPENRIYDNSYE